MELSKIFTEQFSKKFKTSKAILLIKIVIVIVTVNYCVVQYIQLQRDFFANDFAKTIEVVNFNRTLNIDEQFKNMITTIVDNRIDNESFKVARTNFNYNLVSSEDETRFNIYIVSENNIFKDVCDFSKYDVCTTVDEDVLDLSVTTYDIDEQGNGTSKEPFNKSVSNLHIKIKDARFKKMFDNDKDVLLIELDTFREINSSNFIQSDDNDLTVNTNYIYIEDITKLDQAVALLNSNFSDYGFNSAFDYFDSMSSSLMNTIYLLIGFSILMVSCISFLEYSFVKAMLYYESRTIGRLLHFGYTHKEVSDIFSLTIIRKVKPELILVLMINILIILLLEGDLLMISLTIIILSINVIYYYLLTRCFIRDILKNDVSFLLKSGQ